MSEEQAVTTGDDNPFSNPAAFQAALDKVGVEPEPEVKEEPVEEVAVEEEETEEQAGGEEEEDYSKPVPPKRLKKEIEKRRDIETKYQQERDERIKAQRDLENLNATIQKYMKPDQEAEAATVDEEIDALDPETTNRLQKQINDLKKQLATKDQNDTQKEAQYRFATSLEQHQRDFEKNTPDFADSYKFLLNSTYNEYIAAGYDAEAAKAGTMKSLTEKAAVAFQHGKNTAEVAYELAKARGYTPKGKAPAQKTGPDLGKIAENMGKSASLAEVAEASTGGSGGDGGDAISKLATQPGKFIDPKKFAQFLKQQEANN